MNKMPRKELFLISFLIVNSFIWYYGIRSLLLDASSSFAAHEATTAQVIYYSAIIASSLFGAILAGKIGRIKILRFWMVLGCIVTAVPFLFSNLSADSLYVISLLFGLSFGVGMPSCLAYFASLTHFGNRGVTSGVTFLATNLAAVILLSFSDSLATMLAVSLAWRIIGLSAALCLKPVSAEAEKVERAYSFKLVFQDRSFLLYVVPWLIFCLVDRFERIYCEIFFEPEFFGFLSTVEPLVGMIFVFLGGLLADRVGRKRVVIYGFVALGLGYASIGLAPYWDISRYFYTFVDGVAWGIFMVIYMLILWGDLSHLQGASEKYYTLGSIPFFLTELVAPFFSLYVQGIPQARPYAIFSLASFFLFLAVIPLMYAPETLPEKKIKERELKKYVEKAKKVRKKYD